MKWILRIVAALVVVVAVALVGGWLWLRTSLPGTSGEVRLAGLHAPVTVARDDLGIPRITASSRDDAMFALGYVHAQDRLWQMEFQRRVGAGRMAEILGPAALPVDRFMRTLGLYHLAERSVELLEPEYRRSVDAYLAGVNAFLTTHHGALPPEFTLLGYKPEPWRPADVLVWGRLMALQLSSNWRQELQRARLLKVMPPDQAYELWPDYPAGDPTSVGPTNVGLTLPVIDRMLAAIPAPIMPRKASNQWEISGRLTATGKPILANDPHLALEAPILWYLASMSAPGLDLTGVTVPGVPAFIFGHNKRIAWGITSTASDTMDLFVEKAGGAGYLTPDGSSPFETRREVIKVKGAPDVVMTVRATRHGPVISDVLGAEADGQILALEAVALLPDDRTAQAIMKVNQAQNWNDFVAALADFHTPEQNLGYADVDGHIGMLFPGLVPIRRHGDGTLPRPGWTGDYDWTGWIPYDALPRAFDPPAGYIVNANNKVSPDGYPYFMGSTWEEPYRARRIVQMLKGRDKLTLGDMAAMQLDELSLAAVDLKPLLLRAKTAGARAAEARALLRSWDGVTSRDRPEPLIFETWANQVQHDILARWLGDDVSDFTTLRPLFLKAVLEHDPRWCLKAGQQGAGDCDAVVSKALDESLDALDRLYGDDMKQWRWGKAHVATFEALLFRHVPVLDRLTRITAGTGGDGFTVQRGAYDTVAPGIYQHKHGAGMRAIYDLADLDRSRFVIATGQSGNPLSPHWDDQINAWLTNRGVTLGPDHRRPQVLTLVPGP